MEHQCAHCEKPAIKQCGYVAQEECTTWVCSDHVHKHPQAETSGGHMKPGRELDILISEKVMKDVHGYIVTSINEHGSIDAESLCPSYSTDISAAWKVVSHVERQGFLFTIRSGGKGPKGSTWVPWRAVTISGNGKSESIHGDTIPHAICLAALKALGV